MDKYYYAHTLDNPNDEIYINPDPSDENLVITRELNQEELDAFLGNNELLVLRSRREEECFPIINRGQLWYDSLSAAQKDELGAWYRAWLDISETRIVPEKPSWLD